MLPQVKGLHLPQSTRGPVQSHSWSAATGIRNEVASMTSRPVAMGCDLYIMAEGAKDITEPY